MAGNHTKSPKQANMATTGGEVAGVRRSLVAEQLNLTPSGTTFDLCPVIASLSQRSTDTGGRDYVLIRHPLYWSSDHRGVLVIGLSLL